MPDTIQEYKEHVPQMVRTQEHWHDEVQGHLKRINRAVALRITKTIGTMWCAYAFCLLALISFPAAIRSGDLIVIVAWIAQTFIQLVLLPIIIVGQNIQQNVAEARAEADHVTLTAIHALSGEIHTLQETQTDILQELKGRA